MRHLTKQHKTEHQLKEKFIPLIGHNVRRLIIDMQCPLQGDMFPLPM